jgi:predicted dehydrogenase
MSTQPKARLAFIGAGAFATRCLYPNLHLVPQIDLVAICDLDREKAERNARNFGARAVYSDIEELLDKEKPDGIFCVGPAPMQMKLAPHVLRRGIPVYVEKPSAVTSGEAKGLAELAEANNTWGQVGFMKRFAHVYLMAKEVVEREEFGSLSMVKIKFAQGEYPEIWGIDSPRRSMLIGQLCHLFDLARFFGGDVETISAMYHEVTPKQFAYIANVKFTSGAVGIFDLNSLESTSPFRDITEEVQLVGVGSNLTCRDMLTLDWQAPQDWSTAVPRAGRYLQSFQPAWTGVSFTNTTFGYAGEVEHFAKRCIGDLDSGPDLWDSYKSLQIGEAIYESAENGQSISIEN